MTTLLNGKKIAQEIRNEIKKEIMKTKKKPHLAVVLVGKNPASQVYVHHKEQACEEVGIKFSLHRLPEKISQKKLLSSVESLGKDKKIDAILIQLPLPKKIKEEEIINTIPPEKDVDGFHPINIGKLAKGLECFSPATPSGIIRLLEEYKIEISGKNVVIVGRSNIVGKPLALMFLQKNATVTVCHSKTISLENFTKKADILVSAVGKPNIIKADMIKKGVVLIDVGINRLSSGKLVGDVDFAGCQKKASAITPVPGGVGPMTIAMLLENCLKTKKK